MIASTNGITIGYDDAGAGENVLVLVHGHPFDRSMWRAQAQRMSRQADFAKASTLAKAMADSRRPGTQRCQAWRGLLPAGHRSHDPAGG
jgi:pimeloyl-ACP methyl ester carboxylesterase